MALSWCAWIIPFRSTPSLTIDGLAGRSPAIERIRRMIPKLALSRAPVLILGETGSGKEVVARAIHNAHPVGPFVPIDCGTLAGSLIESELFGHVRGAFTGAFDTRPGLIELADGGTAFFDEIGDLPLEAQLKLLRVIQEREFRPVGSQKFRKVNFRVLAATHRDLEAAVRQKTFREDLYYRLNVLKVRVPPLRQRRSDIPLLAAEFLREFGDREMPPEIEQVLVAYDWPGNVRELRNCVERLAAMSSGAVLRLDDLPSALQNATAAGSPRVAAISGPPSPVASLGESEKRSILDALSFTGGHREQAAKLLKIGRATLYRKMKLYGITHDPRARRHL
jgi:DNA-binding NtrC family response regulator